MGKTDDGFAETFTSHFGFWKLLESELPVGVFIYSVIFRESKLAFIKKVDRKARHLDKLKPCSTSRERRTMGFLMIHSR